MSDMSFNFPQIIAVALIGYLAVRWFRASPNDADGQSGTGRTSDRMRQLEQVQQLHAMFPQHDRRALLWDLQRNGGNVEATSNKILEGRPLATPPPSFQPQFPWQDAPNRTSPSAASRPDLITRYNLSSKLKAPEPSSAVTSGVDGGVQHQTWSQDKNERAQLLKKRREEMIIAARRAMEAKERAKGAAQ